MIIIQTRQQSNGLWWCNATINGYDNCFEDVNIIDAQMQMIAFLCPKAYTSICVLGKHHNFIQK